MFNLKELFIGIGQDWNDKRYMDVAFGILLVLSIPIFIVPISWVACSIYIWKRFGKMTFVYVPIGILGIMSMAIVATSIIKTYGLPFVN